MFLANERGLGVKNGMLGTETAVRRARGRALVRHARAVDVIFAAPDQDGRASAGQNGELQKARERFAEVRPYGSRDAEAAHTMDPTLGAEVASGSRRRRSRARR